MTLVCCHPKSSAMFWLKSIKNRVVLVMDNIEQLLERNVKPQFDDLLLTHRKNSLQNLQILTTTRTELTISGQTIVNYKIGQLDKLSSIALLEKCCPNEFEKRNCLNWLIGVVSFLSPCAS